MSKNAMWLAFVAGIVVVVVGGGWFLLWESVPSITVAEPEMVVVPAGSFMMGFRETEKDREAHEGPRNEVKIPRDFAVGKYEVTRAEYAKFVKATGRADGDGCVIWKGSEWKKEADKSWRDPGYRQTDRDPVVCVNWEDARAYARWLSDSTGKSYRLLSEAEWEYAARAKSEKHYWWGNDIGSNNANCNGCGSKWDDKSTAPVGSFRPNDFGIYDTAGNVWEWVEDVSHDSYEGAPRDGSAWRTGGDDNRRVLRGGSWVYDPRELRSANRYRGGTGRRDDDVGFRVARTLP